jgi:hypothetical protein
MLSTLIQMTMYGDVLVQVDLSFLRRKHPLMPVMPRQFFH